jgi:exoribonuclease-2
MDREYAGHRHDLMVIAHRAMEDRGLLPYFSEGVKRQLKRIPGPASEGGDSVHDRRDLLWASIDNDDSLDLDQLTAAERLDDGRVKIMVAVADVDSLVKRGSAVDDHASYNTTSVYTAAGIFPMLPEKLSNDLTSLNQGEDRLAMVVEMVVDPDGWIGGEAIYRAMVNNKAKLAYNGVAPWLDDNAPPPPALSAVPGLEEALRLQDEAACRLRKQRLQCGALQLETIEVRPIFTGDSLSRIEQEHHNRATQLIEDFMIAANKVTAGYLEEAGYPSIRRVLRSPKRWQRIVELAESLGESLPPEPQAKALDDFLDRRREADLESFPDLSLSVVKLMGRGEYVVAFRDDEAPGHFGLAVKDYTHSTAPNRRFPDLLTQRLLKAALAGRPVPYSRDDLNYLASHCTRKEDDANKVERRVLKSAAALFLEGRVGEKFEAIVTGASQKGTWVRLFDPPVEGKLVEGHADLDVSDRLVVKLVGTDVERGFVDFVRI